MKWLTFTAKQSVVLATVILLVIIGAAYFFWYVPQNQQRLEEKQFRCLQTLEKNIREKIASSQTFVKTLMDNYKANNNNYPKDQVIAYIDSFSEKSFTLTKLENRKAVARNRAPAAKLISVNIMLAGSGRVSTTLDSLPHKSTVGKPDQEKKAIDTLVFDENGVAINIPGDEVSFTLKYKLDQFIGGLLRMDVFDNYILFKNPSVIYQTFESGMGKLVDTLKSNGIGKNGDVNPQIRDITLAGVRYKLFTQQIVLKPGTEFTVGGLLTKERYDRERNRLPGQAALSIFIIAISVTLAMPWIKLYQMGSRDRMTAVTGILSLAVPMLLVSILVFAFMQYTLALRSGTDASRLGTKRIATDIARGLRAEIAETYNFMCKVDTLIKPGTQARLPKLRHKGFPDSIQQLLAEEKQKVKLTQIIKLKSNGLESRSWFIGGESPPPVDYSDRGYFRALDGNSPLYVEGSLRKPYSIEPVIARTFGAFTTIMCMKSLTDPNTYTAIAFDVRCLHKPILTPGFQYAVIRGDGRVLYHSDTAKQLNENLFKEFSESETLSASVQGGRDSCFSTIYAGKEYNVNVRPIPYTDLSVVVMDDNAYSRSRLDDRFFFCFTMLFAYFIILGVPLLILFLISVKKTYYKKHYFDVSWVGPNGRFGKHYGHTFISNLIIIVLLLCCCTIHLKFLPFLFILITGASASYLMQTLFYARVYAKKSDRYKSKIRAIWSMVSAIALMDIFGVRVVDYYPDVYAFQGLLIVLIPVSRWLYLHSWHIRHVTSWVAELHYSTTFSLMTFSRLIITSGLPMMLFFFSVFNYDVTMTGRHRQVEFIKTLEKSGVHDTATLKGVIIYQDGAWISNYEIIAENKNQLNRDNGLFYPIMINKEKQRPDSAALERPGKDRGWEYVNDGHAALMSYYIFITENKNQPGWDSADDLATIRLFRLMTMNKEKQLPGIAALDQSGKDRDWEFTGIFGNDELGTAHRMAGQQDFVVSTSRFPYNPPEVFSYRFSGRNFSLLWGNVTFPGITEWHFVMNGLAFWLLLFAVLSGFWFLLHHVIKRVFGLNLPETEDWEKIDDVLLKGEMHKKLLFLIGCPGAKKLAHVKLLIQTGQLKGIDELPLRWQTGLSIEPDYLIADMIMIPNEKGDLAGNAAWEALKAKALNKHYKLIIINQFEYDIKNTDSNRIKLNFMEELLLQNTAKIIIISTVHPVNFLDSLNQKRSIPSGTVASPEHDLERWHVLLGHFRIVIKPLDGANRYDEDIDRWDDVLAYETRSGDLLQEMKEPISRAVRNIPALRLNADSIRLKLGITGHYFYMYIWQSLTKEEKFLLYDLAEDGLVNPYDDYNLILLISKGLIVRRYGVLRLFNQGFRDFILTAIGQSEAMLIQQEIRDSGNWGTLRTPLMLMIIATLLFLFVSERDTYSDFLKYAVAISSGVPIVLQLFSFFRSSNTKTEKKAE